MIYNILLIVQIIVSAALIVLILMQQGKGADAGAAFGSGASGTVFGSQGSGNFLSRMTAILAAVFFLNCLALAWLVANRDTEVGSVMQQIQVEEAAPTSPAATPTNNNANSEVPALPEEEGAEAVDPASTVPAVPEAATESEVPATPEAVPEETADTDTVPQTQE